MTPEEVVLRAERDALRGQVNRYRHLLQDRDARIAAANTLIDGQLKWAISKDAKPLLRAALAGPVTGPTTETAVIGGGGTRGGPTETYGVNVKGGGGGGAAGPVTDTP